MLKHLHSDLEEWLARERKRQMTRAKRKKSQVPYLSILWSPPYLEYKKWGWGPVYGQQGWFTQKHMCPPSAAGGKNYEPGICFQGL